MNEQPQDDMQQDQAEQGLAQQWYDEELKRVLRKVVEHKMLSGTEFKMLCQAIKIDVREVT